MNPQDLEGAELDAAVARALGWSYSTVDIEHGVWLSDVEAQPHRNGWFSPSTRGDHGVPIIYRERISVISVTEAGDQWEAYLGWLHPARLDNDPADGEGPTPLIAAMRAFVRAAAGNTR